MNLQIKIDDSAYSKSFEKLLRSHDRYIIAFGGRGCFAKKQKIITPTGLKKISKLKIGDMVKSVNVSTGEVCYKNVINTFKYKNEDKCIKINYDGKVIICTPDHKFYYKGEFVEIAKILKENGINICSECQ